LGTCPSIALVQSPAFARFDAANRLVPRAEDTGFATSYAAMVQLQQNSPGLKLILGTGGAGTYSDYFPTVTATDATRETASQSVVQFFQTHPELDGIDVDWEFPSTTAQRAQLTAFVSKLRGKFDTLTATTGKPYSISMATGAMVDCINVPTGCIDAQLDIANVTPLIDFYSVMLYSMTGSWTGNTQHHAPLVAQPAIDPFAAMQTPGLANSAENAIAAYRSRGVPAAKLNLGVPFYGVQFCGVNAGTTHGLFQTFSTRLTDPNGCVADIQIDYRNIVAQFTPATGWQGYVDATAQGAWLYNPGQRKFVSYESPATLASKRDWAHQRSLGIMVWDLGADTDSATLLHVLAP
jgi:chitinase